LQPWVILKWNDYIYQKENGSLITENLRLEESLDFLVSGMTVIWLKKLPLEGEAPS
jgi:hypothetical protein